MKVPQGDTKEECSIAVTVTLEQHAQKYNSTFKKTYSLDALYIFWVITVIFKYVFHKLALSHMKMYDE